jgi:hypothetical protein
MALNCIGVDDDNTIPSFTGESGGDWTVAAEFLTATGTDACLNLQTAAMASTGTIDGGTATMAAADNWVNHGFALSPAAAAATARPKQTVVSQAVMRGATRFQKLTRRRSGLFVPEGWEKPIEIPAMGMVAA